MISNKRILGIYLGVLVALIYGVMSGERREGSISQTNNINFGVWLQTLNSNLGCIIFNFFS